MKTENFENLSDRLEQRGWDHLIPELKAQMEAGNPEFTLVQSGSVAEHEVGFELKFRKHRELDHYYFNRINTTLSKEGEVLAQASFRESWELTPEEMYHIAMYGSKVAVYKEGIKNDSGTSFNAWISVNVEEPMDENGYLNLNTYHDNYYKKYPFVLDDALERLPYEIRELVPENTEEIKAQLMTGIPVPVVYRQGEEEQHGILTVNAKIGRIDILDENMEPIQQQGKQAQAKAPEVEPKPQGVDGEKKKPWAPTPPDLDPEKTGKRGNN